MSAFVAKILRVCCSTPGDVEPGPDPIGALFDAYDADGTLHRVAGRMPRRGVQPALPGAACVTANPIGAAL